MVIKEEGKSYCWDCCNRFGDYKKVNTYVNTGSSEFDDWCINSGKRVLCITKNDKGQCKDWRRKQNDGYW